MRSTEKIAVDKSHFLARGVLLIKSHQYCPTCLMTCHIPTKGQASDPSRHISHSDSARKNPIISIYFPAFYIFFENVCIHSIIIITFATDKSNSLSKNTKLENIKKLCLRYFNYLGRASFHSFINKTTIIFLFT